MTAPEPIARFGRYHLLHRIAVGGMAEIFLGCDPAAPLAEQLLVIKRIRAERCHQERFVKMFLDEARVCQRLRHPNIVRMRDFGEVDGRYFLALDYVWGDSLSRLLRLCELRKARFPVSAALYVGAEIAGALDHAHRLRDPEGGPSPVVHRDVTLGNVVVSYWGDVKLLDFGIAVAKERLSRTVVGHIKGTTTYLAPEQILQQEVGPHTDLYQLGVLLYKTLVGREPFAATDEAGIVAAIAQGQLVKPSQVLPGFPPAVERALLRATALDPAQRHGSAAELRAELCALLGPHLQRGREDLASLVTYVTRDRFQRQLVYVNSLLQEARELQQQDELLGWTAAASEPREISVELSDVPATREQRAAERTETAKHALPLAALLAPEVRIGPGPVMTIDPRIRAALLQVLREQHGDVAPADGGEGAAAADGADEVSTAVDPDIMVRLQAELAGPEASAARALRSALLDEPPTIEDPPAPAAQERAAASARAAHPRPSMRELLLGDDTIEDPPPDDR